MEQNSTPAMEEYFVVRPQEAIPGCLADIVPSSKWERIAEIEKESTSRRFIVRAVVSDHIPLSRPLPEILLATSTQLLQVEGGNLTWHLHYGGTNAVFLDLISLGNNVLSHIEVEVETAYPSSAFLPARTIVNEFLDVLMRVVWMPLVVIRLDLLLKGEENPLAYQCILPYTNQINLKYGGGFHHSPIFRPYESLIREAISSSSPYYRFLCAYRLYDGINPLRKWAKDIAKRFSITAPLPRDARIDLDMVRRMGASKEFLGEAKTTNSLFGKLTDHRNRLAHFLLKNGAASLNFSDGFSYQDFSTAAALLLHYSHIAFRDLWLYINSEFNDLLLRGSILPTEELRDMFIIRPDQLVQSTDIGATDNQAAASPATEEKSATKD